MTERPHLVVRESLPDDPKPPGADWMKVVIYMMLFGICVGFWIGFIFGIVEMVK